MTNWNPNELMSLDCGSDGYRRTTDYEQRDPQFISQEIKSIVSRHQNPNLVVSEKQQFTPGELEEPRSNSMPRQLTIAQWKKAQEIGATHYQSVRDIDLLKKEDGQWYGWLVEADGSDLPTKDGRTGWTQLPEDALMKDKLVAIYSKEQLEKYIKTQLSIEIVSEMAHLEIPSEVVGDMIDAAMNAFKAANLL